MKLKDNKMKLVALFFLTFMFVHSYDLTFAQERTDSKDVKKPEVTKPAEIQKTVDVTKSKDITTPIYTPTQKTGISKTAVVTKGTGNPVNSVCIVSGKQIDPKITADYKGKTYAFSSKTSLKKFTLNPESYVRRYENQKTN
jgi:YHS domain-containing protein